MPEMQKPVSLSTRKFFYVKSGRQRVAGMTRSKNARDRPDLEDIIAFGRRKMKEMTPASAWSSPAIAYGDMVTSRLLAALRMLRAKGIRNYQAVAKYLKRHGFNMDGDFSGAMLADWLEEALIENKPTKGKLPGAPPKYPKSVEYAVKERKKKKNTTWKALYREAKARWPKELLARNEDEAAIEIDNWKKAVRWREKNPRFG
jgi:hypothetical protein